MLWPAFILNPLSFPLAVHISDGILTWPWWVGGFVLASVLAWIGVRQIQDEEIPRVALLTAAFFVASLLHIKIGPATSVHLLLNGLLGVVLGWRAALAIPVGLFLQAALIQHGGFTSLGINSCIMVIPALLSRQMFCWLRRTAWLSRPWFRAGLVAFTTLAWLLSLVYSVTLLLSNDPRQVSEPDFQAANEWTFHPAVLAIALVVSTLAAVAERRLENSPEFPVGFLVGEVAVLATILCNYLALSLGGQAHWHTVALLSFVLHLPIAVMEGIVLGFAVAFLARVKPEMLGLVGEEKPACSFEPSP